MRRTLLLVALATAAPVTAGNPEPVTLAQKLIRFHRHYDTFFRSFFGCPAHSHAVEDCRPKDAVPDYREAIEAAKADPFPEMLAKKGARDRRGDRRSSNSESKKTEHQ